MKLNDDADRQTGKTKGHINPDLDRQWVDGYVSFMGLPCSAGSKFVKVKNPAAETTGCNNY